MRKLRLREVDKCSGFIKQSSARAGAESRWEQPVAPIQLFPLFCDVSMALGPFTLSPPQATAPRTSGTLCFYLDWPLHLVTLLSPTFSKIPSLLLFPSSIENIHCYFLVTISEAISGTGYWDQNRKWEQITTPEWRGCGLPDGRTLHREGCPGLCRCQVAKELVFWAGCDNRTGISYCPSDDLSSWHLILYPPGQVLFYEEKPVVCRVKCELAQGGQHFSQSRGPWLWSVFWHQRSFHHSSEEDWHMVIIPHLGNFQFGEWLPYGSLVTAHSSLHYLIVTPMN